MKFKASLFNERVIILYCDGAQNGSTDMAYRPPIIDTGIVEPMKPNNTDRNFCQVISLGGTRKGVILLHHSFMAALGLVNDYSEM